MSTYHVWPENDIIEHEESRECWCGPEVLVGDEGEILLVHHSLDGREVAEPSEGD